MTYKIADNILSPLGETTWQNYETVKAGRSALQRYDHWQGLPEPVMASLFTKEQEKRFTVDGLTRFQSMAVTSIRRALSEISLDVSQPNVVLILSTTKADVESMEESTDSCGLTPAESALAIAHEIGFTTQPIVVCNACISGLSALILANRLLEDGEYDYAVVCGADSQSRFIVSGFQSLKALSAEPCRPFDMERIGLNLGEAAATMVIRGVRSEECGDGRQWVIEAGAVRNDACHISNPAKNGEGSYRALKAAIGEHSTEELAFVNAHGTATIFNDQMESVAIERAGLTVVPVNGYKGYYGHTMGAAGVLETILSMAALDDRTILGTRGFEELGVSGKISVSAAHQHTDKTAFVKMLSGFGGCNAALLCNRGTVLLLDYAGNLTKEPSLCYTHRLTITPENVEVDGHRLATKDTGMDLLKALYHQYVCDYPKFYKMDGLSRLGFVASELLLQAEGRERFVPCDDRAVIFFNHSSSMSADRKYLESIADADNFFPSPSVFVYTLPNIVTGEIAIRNHYYGETSFYILPERSEQQMDRILHASCLDPATKSILTGWLDYEDADHYMAEIEIKVKR